MSATTPSNVCHDSIYFTRRCKTSVIHAQEQRSHYECHDSFICAPWLLQMCAMTQYIVHDSVKLNLRHTGPGGKESYYFEEHFDCVPWLLHTCAMTHIHGVTLLWGALQLCSKTRSYVCHNLSICVLWLLHTSATTPSYVCNNSMYCTWLCKTSVIQAMGKRSHYGCHDSFICVPWLLQMCAMTQYIVHDSVKPPSYMPRGEGVTLIWGAVSTFVTCIYMYLKMYIYVSEDVYIWIWRCIYICMWGCIHIHLWMYIYVSEDVYVCVWGCIHMYLRMYIHVSKDAYICSWGCIYMYLKMYTASTGWRRHIGCLIL